MKSLSSQPRFKAGTTPDEFFATLIKCFEDEDPIPGYATDSRKLDEWLQRFVRTEPHLSGVLSSVATIDKNRGWSVTGGRNQVNRVTNMLHSFECAPGLVGWRPAFGYASKSFWSTNMGCIVELGKEGRNGPVRRLFNTDPTRCSLSGDVNAPLKYYPPKGGKIQRWRTEDFFRVVSVPEIDETFNGLGECAVYRAVGIAQLMVALMRHDAEQLLARAPRGLLLLQGIRKTQWDQAMASHDAEMDSDEYKFFGALAVLASASEKVDAKLLALSQLPQAFNMKEWMDWTLYGYALCFGYDASEFWPVQYGALGRGNETQVQHEKATAKGRLDFVLGFQEQIQDQLPDSVDFTVEQRDDQGDLIRASVVQAWANVAKSLYESQDSTGLPLINNEEARVLLAEYGVIPSSWSPTTEVLSTDIDEVDKDPEVDPGMAPDENRPDIPQGELQKPTTKNAPQRSLADSIDNVRRKLVREQLLSSPQVWRAAEKFPCDPIVRYDYSKEFPKGRITVLWESGEDLIMPRIHVTVPEKLRLNSPELDGALLPPQIAPIIRVMKKNGNADENQGNGNNADITSGEIVDPVQPQFIFSPIINVPAPEVFITNEIVVPKDQSISVKVNRDNQGRISSVSKEVK